MHLPRHHADVLDRVRRAVADDPRFVGLAAGGSLLGGGVDEFSDLDLVVVVADEHHRAVMEQRKDIARSWGPVLACFTGEHVGEPRLLICLYAEPLMHVDLKFLRADELADRAEDPVVLWERGQAVSLCLDATTARPDAFDVQWLEDRFWTWVHYAAAKLGRGELFEVLDFLAFLRGNALAPLALHLRGISPRGVRRLEQHAPELVPAFAETVASHDRAQCARALVRCVDLYRHLRAQLTSPPEVDAEAEAAAVRYLEEVRTIGMSEMG
jgi:hypothetical protein